MTSKSRPTFSLPPALADPPLLVWRQPLKLIPSYPLILCPARGASGLLPFHCELHPALTHPPGHASRAAHDEGVVRHIFCHHRTGTDEGVLANGDAAEDRTVRPKRGTSFNESWLQLAHAGNFAARIDDVRENHGRAAKHRILERHGFIEGDIVLNLDPIAAGAIGSDDGFLTAVAVVCVSGSE